MLTLVPLPDTETVMKKKESFKIMELTPGAIIFLLASCLSTSLEVKTLSWGQSNRAAL